MRTLIEQECSAVAGGHQSECEHAVTSTLILAGGWTGFCVGSVPGAIAGAGAGALVAEIVARPLCEWDEKRKEEQEAEERLDQAANRLQYQHSVWSSQGNYQGLEGGQPTVAGGHQFVADGARY